MDTSSAAILRFVRCGEGLGVTWTNNISSKGFADKEQSASRKSLSLSPEEFSKFSLGLSWLFFGS